MTEWRPVPGCDGYEVSRCGRVRSERKELKGIRKPTGYVWVSMGRHKKAYVHRLVWHAFVGDPGKLDVDHINRVRDDNRLENLQALTRSENLARRIRCTHCNGSGVQRDAYLVAP